MSLYLCIKYILLNAVLRYLYKINIYMKRLFSLFLILILFAGCLSSCKKDKGSPPALPPAESMSIDFSNFTSGKKSADFVSNSKGIEDSHYQFAVIVAGIWNLIINTTLIVPVTSFKLAENQTPVYLDDKTWQWSYNLTVAGSAYSARLTGQIRESDVLWKMYISKTGTGAFTDFLWYEGTSKIDGTGGEWKLYQSSTVPGELLQIKWTKEGTSIGTIKYTYLKNDSYKNNFIEYGLKNTPSYNAYYTIQYFNGTKVSNVSVEWNTTTFKGRIMCPEYLLGTWYCWDDKKTNSICL